MAHYSWLIFALGTVACWGLYGIFLHEGQIGMADSVNGRYKAFLFVGIAYFITAVVAPLVVLLANGANWQYPSKGMWLSLVAGILGAIGAFFVLLALGAGLKHGTGPSVVMSIIFAGAPVVNAVVALSLHPPAGGVSAIRWPFFLGIILAAVGGCLVTLYKPGGPPPKKAVESAQVESAKGGDDSS
ncbi:MAG: hypothetical protein AAF591_13510 [Verrucomicrobiota bacterium]